MNASLAVDPSSQSPAANVLRQVVALWVELCNEFRQRERREIVQERPSLEQLGQYREELKWMIRAARALLNLVSDPDFPDRGLVSEVSGKLHQLESSWKSLNNPMSETDADNYIQKHFPNEPSTGGPPQSAG